MSVNLNTRQVGDVTVIDVSGRIALGEGSNAIRDEVRNLTASGNRKILLNLGDVISTALASVSWLQPSLRR